MVGISRLLHVYLYSQVHSCCCSYWQQLLGVSVNKDFDLILGISKSYCTLLFLETQFYKNVEAPI